MCIVRTQIPTLTDNTLTLLLVADDRRLLKSSVGYKFAMNTELGNMKDHSPRFEESPPPAVDPHLESGCEAIDRQKRDLENNVCRLSGLNDFTQEQEVRKVDVEPKESLADWGVVVCAFLSNVLAALDFTGFAVFYPFLVEHFEATTAAVGWCYSINGFSLAVVALFASYPIQSWGCRVPGVVGCLLFAIGMSLSCLAPNLTTIYYTYGVISGSGSGLAILSTNIIVHQRFSRNRNLASGISCLGFSFGSIIGPILANQLIQLYSWRGAALVFGAVYAQRIPLCLFFRTPKRLTSQPNHAPGSSPRGTSGRMFLRYLKETFNFSILRHARYSIYSIAYFLHIFCVTGYWPHIVNRAIHAGLSADVGVYAAALIGIISTVARLLVSFIANHPKVNSSLVFATGMFLAFLSIVAVFINPGTIGTMTSSVLFGIHLSCTTTVFSVVVVSLMGVALLPKSLAILQFIAGLSTFVAPPLIGWVFDVTGDYNKAFAILGCSAFVSTGLMVALIFITRYRRISVAKNLAMPPSKITSTSEGQT